MRPPEPLILERVAYTPNREETVENRAPPATSQISKEYYDLDSWGLCVGSKDYAPCHLTVHVDMGDDDPPSTSIDYLSI